MGNSFFANQLGHAAARSDITGNQRGEAGCVKIRRITLDRYLLAVLIDEQDHPGDGIHPKPGEDSLDLVILLLAQKNRSVWHQNNSRGNGKKEKAWKERWNEKVSVTSRLGAGAEHLPRISKTLSFSTWQPEGRNFEPNATVPQQTLTIKCYSLLRLRQRC